MGLQLPRIHESKTALEGERILLLQLEDAQGAVKIVSCGHALLEGTICDGGLLVRFTELSGVQADFQLKGSAEPALELSGSGTLQIGPLVLEPATVHATPSSIHIVSPVMWAACRTMATFDACASQGHWRGSLETREILPCLMTKRDSLHATISLQISPAGSAYSAFAVIEGRHVHIPAVPLPTRYSFQEIRRAIFAAVRKLLWKELETNEQAYLAVLTKDVRKDGTSPNQRGDDSSRPVPANPPIQRYRYSGVGPSGYLPAQPREAARSEAGRDLRARGYLNQTSAGSKRSGYLPSALHQRSAGADFPLAWRSTASSATRAVSVASGYLPSARSVSAARSLPRNPSLATQGDRRDCPAEPVAAESDRTMLAEFERVAYAVLRGKDLLQALDAIEEVAK